MFTYVWNICINEPDAILPTMGGQTALNVSLEVSESGFLDEYNVELIGADEEAISKAEDRDKFRKAMHKIGLKTPKSYVSQSLEDALSNLILVFKLLDLKPFFTKLFLLYEVFIVFL